MALLNIAKKIIKAKKSKGKGLGSGIKPSEMREIVPKENRKAYIEENLKRKKEQRKNKAGGGMSQRGLGRAFRKGGRS